MAVVQPATAEMFDAIYPLLSRHNPALPKERWRLLVNYQWRSDGDGLGYVLVEDGEIVGFLSTLYSRRMIDGKEVRLCNTAHWVVREDFRANSLRLLLEVLHQRDCTITNLTSSGAVSTLMKKLGFQLLEGNMQLLFPGPVRPRFGHTNGLVISSDRDTIVATLNATDLKIFLDHAGCECDHVVVRDGGQYCYLVFTRKRRRFLGVDVPYCQLHYISDRGVFLRQLGRIKWHFLRNCGGWFLAVDERMVGRRVGVFSLAHQLRVPRYYRSGAGGIAADRIDNLYTELVLGL